jgi:hypothetical protein
MKKKKTVKLGVRDLRRLRREVLTNIREHCHQLYKRGTMSQEACRAAAIIAAAEISDVLEKHFGIKF